MRRFMLALASFFVPAALIACSSSGGDTTSTGTGAAGGGGGATTSSSTTASSSGSGGATTSSSTTGTGGSTTSSSSGGGGAGPFSCIGSVTWGTPAMAMITVPFSFTDAQSNAAVSGETVKACAKTDATCATPLGMGTTDASGKVTLTLPTGTNGFDGYLDISDTGNKYVPSLFFPTRPLIDNSPSDGVLVASSTFALLGNFVAQPDPSRGHITIAAIDCMGNQAAGVSFSVDTADAMTTTAYINGSLPDKTATKTDSSGAAIIANVPAGPATVTAKLAATMQTIGTYKILIKAGHITVKAAEPTPAGGG